MKAKLEEKDGNKKETGIISLAFRVVPDAEALFAPQMLLIQDDVIIEKRTGVYTTLGHAIAAADEVMDGWAFSEIEVDPEEYFRMVMI
jgi:hypothetical protein